MVADFTIQVDPVRSVVRIAMTGFFERADIDRFVEARDHAHRLLTCGPNEHRTLVDIRAMDIQSQESVAAFQTVLSDPRMASKRLAFVVAQSLARMQIKRAAGEREAAFFLHEDEAERWLLER